MPADDENKNMTALESMLSAAGLTTGNTIWVDLANAILEAYTAYENGTKPCLPGYHTVASIWVQESGNEEEDDARKPAATRTARAGHAGAEGVAAIQGNTLIGFAAHSEDMTHNIIVLRGTDTGEETGYDLYNWGTNTACMLPSGNPVNNYGNVKEDFYNFYTGTDYVFESLAASFNSAVQAVAAANPDKVWIVAAHSLGGALATLGALDAYVSGSYTGSSLPPWLVTFGSLHVGDQSFATAFEQQVPSTFRFANLCDFVPSLVSLEPDNNPADPYVHVGLELTFVWQKWDNWANHSMQFTYLPAVRDYLSVIHVGPRDYPQ